MPKVRSTLLSQTLISGCDSRAHIERYLRLFAGLARPHQWTSVGDALDEAHRLRTEVDLKHRMTAESVDSKHDNALPCIKRDILTFWHEPC